MLSPRSSFASLALVAVCADGEAVEVAAVAGADPACVAVEKEVAPSFDSAPRSCTESGPATQLQRFCGPPGWKGRTGGGNKLPRWHWAACFEQRNCCTFCEYRSVGNHSLGGSVMVPSMTSVGMNVAFAAWVAAGLRRAGTHFYSRMVSRVQGPP